MDTIKVKSALPLLKFGTLVSKTESLILNSTRPLFDTMLSRLLEFYLEKLRINSFKLPLVSALCEINQILKHPIFPMQTN